MVLEHQQKDPKEADAEEDHPEGEEVDEVDHAECHQGGHPKGCREEGQHDHDRDMVEKDQVEVEEQSEVVDEREEAHEGPQAELETGPSEPQEPAESQPGQSTQIAAAPAEKRGARTVVLPPGLPPE
jgi:hypothetical protein